MNTDSPFDLLLSIILIIFGILQIILFFKIWGMTNDVDKILGIIQRSNLNTTVPSEKTCKPVSGNPDGSFNKGQVVVNLKNEDQLKVTVVNRDGTYSCVMNGTNNYVGDFQKNELMDFDQYWAAKKN